MDGAVAARRLTGDRRAGVTDMTGDRRAASLPRPPAQDGAARVGVWRRFGPQTGILGSIPGTFRFTVLFVMEPVSMGFATGEWGRGVARMVGGMAP